MNIKSVAIYPFTRPLVAPLTMAYGIVKARTGFIVSITTNNGIIGFGEISPLPGFGREQTKATESVLEDIKRKIPGSKLPRTLKEISSLSEYVAGGNRFCRFGIETALCDATAKEANLPLNKWLSPEAKGSVPVNYLLHRPVTDWDSVMATIRSGGYRSVKIKVGAGDFDEDIACVRRLGDSIGDSISIRLDANRGWSVYDAILALKQLAGYRIEYIEEPQYESFAELKEVFRQTGVSVALDESVKSLPKRLEAVEHDGCDVIILKPALLGGISETILNYKQIGATGKKAVITSTLETETGIAAQLHLTASLPGDLVPCGFDTLRLFNGHPVAFSTVENGRMSIPDGNGVGYEPKSA